MKRLLPAVLNELYRLQIRLTNMIYGIGTDICDIRRIRASLERHGDRFAQKVLSEAEFSTWKARSARWPERGCGIWLPGSARRRRSARRLVWACACP